MMDLQTHLQRTKRLVVTRRCWACHERYSRRLSHCPVCGRRRGDDGGGANRADTIRGGFGSPM